MNINSSINYRFSFNVCTHCWLPREKNFLNKRVLESFCSRFNITTLSLKTWIRGIMRNKCYHSNSYIIVSSLDRHIASSTTIISTLNMPWKWHAFDSIFLWTESFRIEPFLPIPRVFLQTAGGYQNVCFTLHATNESIGIFSISSVQNLFRNPNVGTILCDSFNIWSMYVISFKASHHHIY